MGRGRVKYTIYIYKYEAQNGKVWSFKNKR